ncbi:flagellar basal body-associated FliL family protein [Georgenia sp. 311]|uniref:Flagellar protein FliL n=1 Tax=Georgenia wutianyii TaxID=2585135 RepID=A0ABX5VIK3_9MICO|nr:MULTISPECIES: flagellar basal body-associated FliL family protein [Georgenia]QDB78177.1 flagellar basal body-associated FliL family protein [Georgenia wutianyii]TNC21247.1 flagellar basal body-associated FliL family protein [Georgenia sp. 311]
MPETRVIGAPDRKIGGAQRPPAPSTRPAAPQPAAPKRRKGKTLAVVLVLIVGVAAVAFLLTRPEDSAATPQDPEPGMTIMVEPRNINLADGRYLRMGFAIELVAEAEEVPVAQATDIAIALFSGRSVDEVNDAAHRAELKDELTRQLTEAYDGEVHAVYFTDFVTQ